jgi:hypothetical protein
MAHDTKRLVSETIDEPSGSHLWTGMIGFASMMMLLLGAFHVLGGFIALLEQRYYNISSADLILANYTWWGIFHMALGAAAFLTGIALFYRQSWSRPATVVIATLSAMANLTFLSAAPGWYGLLIVLDFLVIYAVTVHFEDEVE